MNRNSLALILALMPLASAAVAAPTTTIGAAKGPAMSPPVQTVKAVQCTAVFDKLLSDLKSGMIITAVNSTLINGEAALAESPKLPLGAGFNSTLSSAALSGETVAIKSHVAAPGGSSSSDMTATLERTTDAVRMRWTYKGKSHTSNVDACSSGYWTATSSSSAIAVKLAPPIEQQIPR